MSAPGNFYGSSLVELRGGDPPAQSLSIVAGLALIEAIDSPRFRHCFDTGHWNLFNKVSMEEWFSMLGSHIVETHIHDNAGTRDDHAPIGDGTIDFDTFFTLLARHAPNAVWTIEAHSREKLKRALHCLAPFI